MTQNGPGDGTGSSAENPFPADCARRYIPHRILASGGVGTVWLAEDTGLDRWAAVKLLKPAAFLDSECVERFIAEARITAAITHPNAVRVYDYGTANGIPWIAYEYIPGNTLGKLAQMHPFSVDRALQAVLQVADALGAAHELGIIHRDLKPDNVLASGPNHYKVVDFGIAKWSDDQAVKTSTGTILGTPRYMSPEQIRCEGVTAATDIYALGSLLYELVAGEAPFPGRTADQCLHQHLTAPVPRLHTRMADVPPEFDSIVTRAMAKRPADRYPDTRSMCLDLQQLLDKYPNSTYSESPRASGNPDANQSGPPTHATTRREEKTADTITTNLGMFGQYLLAYKLGQGGMGTVYRAFDVVERRDVALKVVRTDRRHDPEILSRFQREARLLSRFDHPAIVKIYDCGHIDGAAFIAMELLEGRPLSEMIAKSAPFDWHVALTILQQIADGLKYLHASETLHRDISASNIVVESTGRVRICDLGMGRDENATMLTEPGTVVGNVAYIAPELLHGEMPTAGSDIWSLGVVLYEMLTGRFPFDISGLPIQDVARVITEDPIVPADRVVPTVPLAVSRLAQQMLARPAMARPKSAQLVCETVTQLLNSQHSSMERAATPTLRHVAEIAPVSPSAAPAQRSPDPLRRLTAVPKGSALLLLAVTCIVFVRVSWHRPSPTPAASGTTWAAKFDAKASMAPSSKPHPTPVKQDFPFDDWASVLPFLPSLRSGGRPAGEAVALLRRRCRLNLANEPGPWMAWVGVGSWLAEAPGPPLVFGLVDQGTRFDRGAYYKHLDQQWGSSPISMASALQCISKVPEDIAPWLILGHLFERANRVEAARRLYAFALDHLVSNDSSTWPVALCEALSRALLLVHEKTFEATWVSWASRRPIVANAVRGLHLALNQDNQPRMLAALERGMDDFFLGYSSGRFLSAFVQKSGDPRLIDRCTDFLLRRGEIERAQKLLEGRPNQARWTHTLAQLVARSTPPQQVADSSDPGASEREVYRLIEAGDLTGAAGLLQKLTAEPESGGRRRRSLILDVAGLGSTDPWILRSAETVLPPSPNDAAGWSSCVDALATPSGTPLFQKALSVARKRNESRVLLAAVEAVWLSRCGRHSAALDVLERLGNSPLTYREYLFVLETVCRPLFAERLVPGFPGSLVRRARNLLPKLPPSAPFRVEFQLHMLTDALVYGFPGSTVDSSLELFRQEPDHPIWGLFFGWALQIQERSIKYDSAQVLAGWRYQALAPYLLQQLGQISFLN